MALLATVTLAGCGLLPGGGVSQEDYDILAEQLGNANIQLEEALNQAGAAGAAQVDAQAVRSELEAAKAEIARLSEITDGVQSDTLSLEAARLVALRQARQEKSVYAPQFQDIPLVWQVQESSEGDEFYYVTLTYRPSGNFDGSAGSEEFILSKTGTIEFRQVLTDPQEGVEPTPEPVAPEG